VRNIAEQNQPLGASLAAIYFGPKIGVQPDQSQRVSVRFFEAR
jgi:hypothetical protein